MGVVGTQSHIYVTTKYKKSIQIFYTKYKILPIIKY
jgi:hypothetical protein